MGLRKCPRCELNYIRDDEKYCNVCKREMKGEPDVEDGVVLCIECGCLLYTSDAADEL